MKPKQLIILCASVASVLLCVTAVHWGNRALVGDVPHAHAAGERLAFESFRPNEQIVVSAAHGDRDVRRREYHFYWAAGERYVDILGNRDATDHGTAMQRRVNARPLAAAEAKGLDAMVAYFRRRGEEAASGVAEYHLTYIRDNQAIGDEFFVGFRLPQQLAFYLQERTRGQPVTDADLDQLAVEGGVMPAELRRLMPFEALESSHSGE